MLIIKKPQVHFFQRRHWKEAESLVSAWCHPCISQQNEIFPDMPQFPQRKFAPVTPGLIDTYSSAFVARRMVLYKYVYYYYFYGNFSLGRI